MTPKMHKTCSVSLSSSDASSRWGWAMISRPSPSNAPAAVANANFGSSTWKTPALTAGARGRRQQRRIRLGIQIAPVVAARLRSTRTIPHNDEIATLTAELDEDSAVRLLTASDSPDDQGQACRRAADLATGIDGRRRPLAALQAELRLIETLTATGRVAEARAGVFARLGTMRRSGATTPVVDAGLS
jgi:ATP/maltotriose-dependent transcriptional regulator MalT